MTRRFWVFIHRWAGLLMTIFLIIVGLTGSLLAFNSEPERLISPQLYAAPRPGMAPLDLATLAARAEILAPQARAGSVYFGEPDQVTVSMSPRTDPAAGVPYELGFDQLLLDPWTGDELGRRTWGDILQGSFNLIPFIYKLHFALALGTTGAWVLGMVALVWTVDCLLDYRPGYAGLAELPQSLESPRLDWRGALATGERLMADQAASQGFSVERPVSLSFDPAHGVYTYTVRSSRDIQDKLGGTNVYFEANSGALRVLDLPAGQYRGNTVTSWLVVLHMANVFGLPYRIFVCALGFLITMLSATGVYSWWKKYRARKFSASHRRTGVGNTARDGSGVMTRASPRHNFSLGLASYTAAPRGCMFGPKKIVPKCFETCAQVLSVLAVVSGP